MVASRACGLCRSRSRHDPNAIETGKYDPSLPLAFKIARVFGKNVEEVFLYPEEQDQARPPQV
jgi:hypothetical protein